LQNKKNVLSLHFKVLTNKFFIKMNKRNVLFGIMPILAAVMLTAFKCGNGNEPENGTKIQFSVIGQGNNIYSGDNGFPEQYSVIRNNTDWENLITEIDANLYNNPISSTFTETDIDFSQFIIIAVVDEVKSGGNWSIDVTDITEYSGKIIVTVENLNVVGFANVITQPFQIIKIPVSNRQIVFNKNLTRYH
jgi:hypothetical protein